MISCGRFITPMGTLVVEQSPDKKETWLSVKTTDAAITWVFREKPDGWKFDHFEIGLLDEEKYPIDLSRDGVVLCCEHITPTYQGTVYQIDNSGLPMQSFVCPDCVTIAGVLVKDSPVCVMDREIWTDVQRNLHVLKLDLADSKKE